MIRFLCLVLPFVLAHCGSGTVAVDLSDELDPLAAGDADNAGDSPVGGDPAIGDLIDDECTPPEPVAVEPSSNAIDVEVDASVQVTFDQAIAPESVTVWTFSLDPPAPAVVTVSEETIALHPGSALAFGTTYTATVTDAVTGVAGCPLVGDLRWSFTTEPEPITPALILDLVFRQDVVGDSGIWFSSQGDPNDLPRLSVNFTDEDGAQQTHTYQGGLDNAFAFYIRQAGFEDGGCHARNTDGSGRECHRGEILIKEDARRRGLFRVDLSDIPAGATIDACTLRLHLHEGEGLAYGDHTSVVGIYRQLTDWDWDTATWAVPWSVPGGDFGAKVLDLRAHEDMHQRGWNKANPTGSIDLTEHLRALQSAR